MCVKVVDDSQSTTQMSSITYGHGGDGGGSGGGDGEVILEPSVLFSVSPELRKFFQTKASCLAPLTRMRHSFLLSQEGFLPNAARARRCLPAWTEKL